MRRHGLWVLAGLAGCLDEPEQRVLPANPDWESTVQQSLVASEYAPVDDGMGLRATNRAHDLRARFTAEGVSLTPRTKGGQAVTLSLSAFGRDSSTETLSASAPALGACDRTGRVDAAGDCLRQVRYERASGLLEWWENRTDGLQQGFTVERRPEGPGELALVLEVRGAVLEADGPGAVWLRSDDQQVRYAGLVAWDDRGSVLPARMEVRESALWLLVDDRGATGTVTIDPVLTTPDWSGEGEQSGAYFGSSVSGAGDVNGDGFDDVVVGAYNYDGGLVNEGKAWLYLGSPGGLATTAAWSAEGDQASAWFGYAVSNAGDVNGDGLSEVIIGAYSYDNGQSDEGRVFLYLGTNLGLTSVALWMAEGDQASARFGESLSSAGDVNGDSYADVLVGAGGYDNGQSNEGRASLYLGSALGLGSSPAWTGEGDQVNAYFGRSVSSAGDVNGDGYDDLLIGAYGYDSGQSSDGRALVYLGSASGPAATPIWTADGDQDLAYFGWSVSGAGDVNGDGYADLLIGAYGYDGGEADEGRASVYLGSASGPAAAPVWTAEIDQAAASFGSSVSTAGDVNGDGYADLLIGAEDYDDGNTDEGGAFIYLGSSAGPLAWPSWEAEGNQLQGYFGRSVSAAGDVDGDGLADVVVGAPYSDNGQSDEGAVSLYRGSAALPSIEPFHTESDQAEAEFGTSVASAGDVNGDGYNDVVVGAPGFDTASINNAGQIFLYLGSPAGISTVDWLAGLDGSSIATSGAYFGRSVSSAGDVNGDGYADIIAGAYGYDTRRGSVVAYFGSPLGLSESWRYDGGGSIGFINSFFGYTVSSAGDVNGDGYSDIIASAPYYDNGEGDEGAVFGFFGSPSGFGTAPDWSFEIDEPNAHIGYALAAGDVNGDGYSDILVGTSRDNGTEQGSLLAYYGSPLGPALSPSWEVWSEQRDSYFALSVAAGDVNGDGYSDAIVGASDYDGVLSGIGRVYVYFGSPAGLSASPSWFDSAEQAGQGLGRSVAAADVDADGYDDVIAGSFSIISTSGDLALYRGSPSGPQADESWSVAGDQSGSLFGTAVGSSDVNGDGYGDILAGAPSYTSGDEDEGRLFLYLGNGGDGTAPGLSFAHQSRRQGSAVPIVPGLTANGLDIALRTARGPWGRTRVAMRMQGAGLPGAFDDPRYTLSPAIDSGAAGSLLQAELPGLGRGYGYRWRTRVQIAPARGAKQSAGAWKYGGPVYTSLLFCPDVDLDTYGDHTLLRDARINGVPDYISCYGAPDCDDTRADVNPAAQEVCDGEETDEDCDSLVDDDDSTATGQTPWYTDLDDDGYGTGSPSLACDAQTGTVPLDGDCDDGRSDVNPGVAERCDDADIDEDCDSLADDADDSATEKLTFWLDADNDGYGSLTEALLCDLQLGYAANPDDCTDTIAAIHPGAQEVCDLMDLDEDCDSLADDADDSVTGQTSWYTDLDDDGYGAGVPALSCELLPEHVTSGGDCDDSLPSINPEATEAPGDSLDSDCDGTELCFADADNDGQRTEQTVPSADMDCLDMGEALSTAPSGDCDDANPDVYGGATELPGDGLDSDCDKTELCFVDADADGYRPDDGPTTSSADLSCSDDGLASALTPSGDCDDSDPSYHPDAPEDCTDPADYNCDGSSGYADSDGDGYAACEDCDDSDPSRHPGAEEIEGDGIDSDCDGEDPEDKGCGCAQGRPPLGPWPLLALAAGLFRRK